MNDNQMCYDSTFLDEDVKFKINIVTSLFFIFNFFAHFTFFIFSVIKESTSHTTPRTFNLFPGYRLIAFFQLSFAMDTGFLLINRR